MTFARRSLLASLIFTAVVALVAINLPASGQSLRAQAADGSKVAKRASLTADLRTHFSC